MAIETVSGRGESVREANTRETFPWTILTPDRLLSQQLNSDWMREASGDHSILREHPKHPLCPFSKVNWDQKTITVRDMLKLAASNK